VTDGHVRHSDPDLIGRSILEERDAAEAKHTLWILAETGSRYHVHLERAERFASEQGIRLSTAILDECARIRLDWHDPSGAGAHCWLDVPRRGRATTYHPIPEQRGRDR
jgi:hypothetical protein